MNSFQFIFVGMGEYLTRPGVGSIIVGRERDIGGFSVHRILPHVQHRHIGPYVFFDHMGPADFADHGGMDVRPHPHIGLATMTYLLEGEILHRDNLGTEQVITPGAINWMTAGRGIVHSERTPPRVREAGVSRLHGIQVWIALPTKDEECEPDFTHYPSESLPVVDVDGSRVRALVGSLYGASSPVRTRSPLFYADAEMPEGASLPMTFGYEECAAYVTSGSISVGDTRLDANSMLIFPPKASPVLRAETNARLMLLGGDRVDGPRHIFWNFVSSSQERIEQAKREWQEGKFPKVPGDADEFIPLP